ncbi:unnamed protein product, partial [Ectocarpus sp. 12 AP-2014]
SVPVLLVSQKKQNRKNNHPISRNNNHHHTPVPCMQPSRRNASTPESLRCSFRRLVRCPAVIMDPIAEASVNRQKIDCSTVGGPRAKTYRDGTTSSRENDQ